ncbi:MAG TPA: hypothetical protein VGG28_08525 [Kofleriaceae bacterium]|jgi:hypothetical protein
MRAACLIALATTACVLPPVPLEPSPITKGAGKRPYEKAGVPLDSNCGERFQLAVTGVDEAEHEVAACHTVGNIMAASLVSSLAFGATAASLGEYDRGPAFEVSIGLAVTALAVGLVAAVISNHHMRRAIDVYNATIEP